MSRPKINDEINVKIDGVDEKGRGTFKIDKREGLAYFTLPGETVRGVITSRTKGTLRLKTNEIVSASPDRVAAPCVSAGRCGGCPWQMFNYDLQCQLKLDHASATFATEGLSLAVKDLIRATSQFHYRNRMDYVFGSNGELGLKEPEQWNKVLDLPNCLLLSEAAPKIMNIVREYLRQNNIKSYDQKSGVGLLRYLVIREGKNTNERMVMIVTSGEATELPLEKKIISSLSPLATSIIHGINPELTDLSIPKTIRTLLGNPYLMEKINGFVYKIQPASFFQTNSAMAAKLQNTVVEFANVKKSEICLDLYCGNGFLTLALAKESKETIGVELDEAAVASARENAALNSATNVIFSSGSSESILPIVLSRDKPDVIVVDPPRPGLHPSALAELVNYRAKRLVYVSCNPVSLAHDLKTLLTVYKVDQIRCLDLFPHTPHVETVVSLKLMKREA
jgi:23S rRNA (uracil1939-C5)-methyltransferase